MANIRLLSLRVAFMSAGVLSTALMLKLSFPVLVEFLNCELPLLCSIVVSWLKPPYLYLVLNFIILSLVASSKLQSDADGLAIAPPPAQIKAQEDEIFADPSPIKPVFAPIDADPVDSPSTVVFGFVDDVPPEEKSVEAVVGNGEGVAEAKLVSVSETETETETENEEFVLYRSNWMSPEKNDLAEQSNSVFIEKPLASQRFSDRKSSEASLEGGKALLGITKPKRQDTLESTWRMITEGRPMPLTRHLNKSETIDTRHDDSHSPSPAQLMKTAEKFNDQTTSSNNPSPSPSPGGGSGRLNREPSLSQDELNRRVEAFISKFNEEMRLQRQQSLQQYMEVVGGHGSH